MKTEQAGNDTQIKRNQVKSASCPENKIKTDNISVCMLCLVVLSFNNCTKDMLKCDNISICMLHLVALSINNYTKEVPLLLQFCPSQGAAMLV